MASLFQIAERDVDLVHFHAFGPSAFAAVPKLVGRKVIVQGHGLEWRRSRWGTLGKAFLKATERPSVWFADQLTVVSKIQQRYLREVYGRDSVVITTGVNPPKIRKPDLIQQEYGLGQGEYVLFASRLVQEKNPDLLIEAFRQIKTDKKLVIAGDAKHEEAYIQQLRDLAADDERILFTGFVTGSMLEELFSNAYLFVLPSDLEGLATVLLEAMSYGRCCLTSDIEENVETLGKHGFTFHAGSKESLARELENLLESEQLVEQMGAKSSVYALAEFSWDTIAVQMEELYQEVLDHKVTRE